jgi:uncharacterized protein YceH (UPF0502 family)
MVAKEEQRMILTAEEARVLGVLLEKEMTTPEYYPLTLNSLTLGCNQKNNREPVTAFDEATVVRAVDGLREKKLVSQVSEAGARVPKYRNLVAETMGLEPKEKAVLCELLVRGPQTWAELRGRAARMAVLGTVEEAEAVLQGLVEARQLLVKLPRQPGLKESRYAQTLCAETPAIAAEAEPPASASPETSAALPSSPREVRVEPDRFARLEAEVAAVRADLADVRAKLDALLKHLT